MHGMNLGLFLMPCHPPGRALRDSNRWNVEVLEHADRLGYDEAWIGEHFTVPWEPIPAPDLLVAQALRNTERIRLGRGQPSPPPRLPPAEAPPAHRPGRHHGDVRIAEAVWCARLDPDVARPQPARDLEALGTCGGGRGRGGTTADRRNWRVVKEVFVAETDQEARRYALDGCLGDYFREFNLPLFRDWGLVHLQRTISTS